MHYTLYITHHAPCTMFCADDYANFIPSRNPMPTPHGGPAISVGGLIQVQSRDNGHTWHNAALLNGTTLPLPLLPGVGAADSTPQNGMSFTISNGVPNGMPNHPHNVEPKLVRLPLLGLLVLSSGRCGQYVWWANETDVMQGHRGAIWQSVDIRTSHNAAVGAAHSDWRFAGTCSESTAYTSVSVLGDPARATEIVVVYDKTHIEVPKTLPKGAEVNYLFSVRLTFSRQ